MNLKHKIALIGLAVATLLLIGGLAPEWRYPACCLAAILGGTAFITISQRILWELAESRRTTASEPMRTMQLLAPEIHSMSVILNRFPACTLPTTSWSMRFTNLHCVLEQLDKELPVNIVEFGSGLSTLMVASWLRERGRGHLYSFDHDETWASATRSRLENEGLEDWAEVIVAPLAPFPYEGETLSWYRTAALDALPSSIDFLIVDGPPGSLAGPHNRLPAIPLLRSRLSGSATILLDDAFRAGEQEIVRRWIDLMPQLASRISGQSTGLAILTPSPRDTPSGSTTSATSTQPLALP